VKISVEITDANMKSCEKGGLLCNWLAAEGTNLAIWPCHAANDLTFGWLRFTTDMAVTVIVEWMKSIKVASWHSTYRTPSVDFELVSIREPALLAAEWTPSVATLRADVIVTILVNPRSTTVLNFRKLSAKIDDLDDQRQTERNAILHRDLPHLEQGGSCNIGEIDALEELEGVVLVVRDVVDEELANGISGDLSATTSDDPQEEGKAE
jgi:hypothetical protein